MYIESAAQSRETAASLGSDDLAEAFMLLRASTLKIIRLQLAIERGDRHVALSSLDDLIMLDRRLQDYLSGVAGAGEQLMFRGELDSERAALSKEKLTLAAGILRRSNSSADHSRALAEPDMVQPGDEDWLGSTSLQLEPEEPRRSRWWLAIIPILLLALGAAVYFAAAPAAAGLFASSNDLVRQLLPGQGARTRRSHGLARRAWRDSPPSGGGVAPRGKTPLSSKP